MKLFFFSQNLSGLSEIFVICCVLHRKDIKKSHAPVRRRKEINMKKDSKPRIGCVEFVYTGDEKSFDNFLKATVRDYLTEEKTQITLPLPSYEKPKEIAEERRKTA